LAKAAHFEEAVCILEKGLQLDLRYIDRAELAWRLGFIFGETMNRESEAIALAKQALSWLANESDSFRSTLLQARSYALITGAVWSRDPEAGADAARRSIPLWERVVKVGGHSPEAAEAYRELAFAHNTLGNPKQAIALCRRSLECNIDPVDRLIALTYLAEGLRLVGETSAAEDTVLQALQYSKADPLTRPNLYETLGMLRRETGKVSGAKWAFEQALKSLEMNPYGTGSTEHLKMIYGNLAELHREEGHVSAAISMFEQLLAQYPEESTDRPRILNLLGECHAAAGSYQEARRLYRRVLASPNVNEEDRQHAQDRLAVIGELLA
jgi:tetratricopeptide (TPR) repeat protein